MQPARFFHPEFLDHALLDSGEGEKLERFGEVVGHGDERIPAPPLPKVRLTRRRRRL